LMQLECYNPTSIQNGFPQVPKVTQAKSLQ
jgi:hypothetical protein